MPVPLTLDGASPFVEARNGVKVAVLNVLGSLFLDTPVSPWEIVDELGRRGARAGTGVDPRLSRGATSEKIAMARWLDGRVTAVIGTHTHVQDERCAHSARRHGGDHRRGMNGAARLRDRRRGRAGDPSDAHAASRPLRARRGGVRLEGVVIDCSDDGRAHGIELLRVPA